MTLKIPTGGSHIVLGCFSSHRTSRTNLSEEIWMELCAGNCFTWNAFLKSLTNKMLVSWMLISWRNLCVEFFAKFSTDVNHLWKQGNSVYVFGKWVCLLVKGIVVWDDYCPKATVPPPPVTLVSPFMSNLCQMMLICDAHCTILYATGISFILILSVFSPSCHLLHCNSPQIHWVD